jgi:antitoxin component YwqK of YwqJK toxin-antitoxin module
MAIDIILFLKRSKMKCKLKIVFMLSILFLVGCNQRNATPLAFHGDASVWKVHISHSEKSFSDSIIEYKKGGKVFSSIAKFCILPKDTLPYFLLDGIIHCKTDYLENVTHFDTLGRICCSHPYLKGRKHGLQIEYFANSKVKSEQNYVNGNLTGLQTTFYSNGIMESKGEYLNNEPIGKHSFYDSLTGRIKVEKFINSNHLIYYIKRYNEQGGVVKEEGDSTNY